MRTALALMVLVVFRLLTSARPRAKSDLVPGVWKNVTPRPSRELQDHVFCQGVTLDSKNPTTLYLHRLRCTEGRLVQDDRFGKTWKKIGLLDERSTSSTRRLKHLYCVDGVPPALRLLGFQGRR